MLYHLFKYLWTRPTDLPGSGMFQYMSFRAAAAVILSLLIVIIFGRPIIDFLRRKQIGEEIRDLGLQGQLQKKGTPTMGGVIILVAILVPMLLSGSSTTSTCSCCSVSTVWLGLIGGLDDYIKVFRHRKEGLKGRFKIVGAGRPGIIVGTTMWLSPDIVVREKATQPVQTVYLTRTARCSRAFSATWCSAPKAVKTTQTTIPFVKEQRVRLRLADGRQRHGHMAALRAGGDLRRHGRVERRQPHGRPRRPGHGRLRCRSSPCWACWPTSRDTSSTPTTSISCTSPRAANWWSSPRRAGRCLVGFLWYNSFPAQIFMGDTGSLAIGGVIAVFALCIRKELLLPLLCGVFLVESFSVMLPGRLVQVHQTQVRRGRRILLMSPIHHHYQKKGIFETKIVLRFWIISLLLAAITLVTLKIRWHGEDSRMKNAHRHRRTRRRHQRLRIRDPRQKRRGFGVFLSDAGNDCRTVPQRTRRVAGSPTRRAATPRSASSRPRRSSSRPEFPRRHPSCGRSARRASP